MIRVSSKRSRSISPPSRRCVDRSTAATNSLDSRSYVVLLNRPLAAHQPGRTRRPRAWPARTPHVRGRSRPRGPFAPGRGWARIEVSDAGTGEWHAPHGADQDAECGRGLAIVAALADKLGH